MTEWQWHQLDHMQSICTSLQTDNQTDFILLLVMYFEELKYGYNCRDAHFHICLIKHYMKVHCLNITRMWANAQRDGRPAEHRWRPLFNAANVG